MRASLALVAVVLGVVGSQAHAHPIGRNDIAVFSADAGGGRRTIAAPTDSRFLVSPCWTQTGALVTIAEDPATIVRRSLAGPATVIGRLPSTFINGRLGPGCVGLAEVRRSARGLDVWLRPASRQPPLRVLRTTASWETQPAFAWSANGRRVAIADRRYPGSVVVVSSRTGQVMQRFESTTAVSMGAQALSPDGRRVVFTTGNSFYDFAVRVGDVRSGRVRTLAQPALDAAWSPQGDRIALVDEAGLEVLDAAGKRIAHVSIASSDLESPMWSSDGQRLAFRFAGVSELLASRVAVATVTSSPDAVAEQRLGPTSSYTSEPQWSPDGRLLAVAREPFVSGPGDDR
jgi:Tol biopolymer transport system component